MNFSLTKINDFFLLSPPFLLFNIYFILLNYIEKLTWKMTFYPFFRNKAIEVNECLEANRSET